MILDPVNLPETRRAWRAAGQKVVFTNGCFDLSTRGTSVCSSRRAPWETSSWWA
jgi:bifunctional ADP-heptose synthase (sugar kinase/adenylyltransferase)